MYVRPDFSSTRWHSAIWGPTEGESRPIGMRQLRACQAGGQREIQVMMLIGRSYEGRTHKSVIDEKER